MSQMENKNWIQAGALIISFLLLFVLCHCIFYLNLDRRNHYVFGATFMTMNNDFYTVLNDEFKAAVEEKGDYLITLDPALDSEKQIEQMEYLIEKKVDAILLNPVDWKAIKPGLEAARKADIPVIVIDAPVYDSDLVTTTIVSDNYEAGVLCAKDMMERVDRAKILVLTHSSAKSGRDRIQGFVDTVKEHKNYKIVDTINTEGQAERAFLKTERLLKQTKEYDVVMSLNDPSALGAIAAFDEVGYQKHLLAYGIDGSPDGKKMVKQRKLTGTVIQFPREMGRKASDTVYRIVNGEEVDREILMNVEMADTDNILKYDINTWQ